MNKTYRLILQTLTANDCTVGKLFVEYTATRERLLLAHTIEKPWLNNEPFNSCIPEGSYLVKPTDSPKFGPTYYVESISDVGVGLDHGERTHILFHAGNTVDDTSGCIVVGENFGVIDGKRAVLNSKATMQELLRIFDGYTYKLDIFRH